MIYIDKGYLLELCGQLMDGHVSYQMGGKVKLSAEPSDIKAIDCSGFTRYLINRVTDGQVTPVDGSDEQNAWCKKHKLLAQTYSHVAGLSDGCLRIAFMPRPHGHVWLVMDGMTIESHGGKGPHRRTWSTPILTRSVKTCYVLAHLYSMTAGPATIT